MRNIFYRDTRNLTYYIFERQLDVRGCLKICRIGFFYGHNGGAPGMSSWLSIYPNSGNILIVLSNYDPPIADEIQRFFVEQVNLD